MVASTAQRLAQIEQSLSDLEYGVFRAPNGPATIRGQSIKPKTVNAGLINVDDLQSVNSKTGSLSVTGSITMAAGGSFSSGQTAYDTGSGFWLEYNAGVPRFSLGNSGGNKITWNGITLAITGSITATTGTIGGWIIGTTDLTESSGGGTVGLASSGSVRIWVGSATPSAAPFRVSSAGVATMIGAVIGSAASGARVELNPTNGVSVFDSGGTVRGRLLTDGSGFLGSTDGTSTGAAIRWTTAGVATINADKIITGTLSFGSGGTMNSTGAVSGTFGGVNLANLTVTGTITLGSGGKIIDADGSYWDQSGISLVTASGAFGDSITWKNSGGTSRGSVYVLADTALTMEWSSGVFAYVTSSTFGVGKSSDKFLVDTTTPATKTAYRFYPGNNTSIQSTYYIDAGATGAVISNGIGIGGMLGISSGNTINFIAPGSGGSATNWSGFTSANIPDKSAGYFKIQIAGTNYRVPVYADA